MKTQPDSFRLETTTFWDFPKRGAWATHNGRYRGNWSPYVVRNLLLRYSQPGDLVCDPFVGGGTTLVEAKLLKRRGIGVDINPQTLEIAKANLAFRPEGSYPPQLIRGDARSLGFLKDGVVDLVCTHPPYADAIHYSEGIEGDLSLLSVERFVEKMEGVAQEFHRILKDDGTCAVLIGDMRKNKRVVPLGFGLLEVFLHQGFRLREIIIKKQNRCRSTGFWFHRSIEYNFLLLAHEYLFVLDKSQ